MIALANSITGRKTVERLNLADNAITDNGMSSVRTIIANCKGKLKQLNLASNMISGAGFEVLLDDLIVNTSLKHLDLGVHESSMRKNSLGVQGASYLSYLLINNKTLESLALNNNDFGPEGGNFIGDALAENRSLKVLKISENDLRSQGAIAII
jgi:Ran GTPase-activating protein (RanGAP) involved in mRNA processing and transport